MLVQCLVVFGVPDTTYLDSKSGSRVEFSGWDTSVSNRLPTLRTNFWLRNRNHRDEAGKLFRPALLLPAWRGRAVVTVITNPPGGLGLLIGEAPETGAVVKRVGQGAPAWQKGVREGDLIVGIDSQSVIGMPLRDIALRLRGPIGSEVNLTLSRPGSGQTLTSRRRREVVSPPPGGFDLWRTCPTSRASQRRKVALGNVRRR